MGALDGNATGLSASDSAEERLGVSVGAFFSICGGWSVVECLPVVQGGMDRNSSKVRTRGLQQLQPMEACQYPV